MSNRTQSPRMPKNKRYYNLDKTARRQLIESLSQTTLPSFRISELQSKYCQTGEIRMARKWRQKRELRW